MATNVVTLSRPVASIVTDLSTARLRLEPFYRNTDEWSDAEGQVWDAAEDRKLALERELKAAIYRQTGVSWDLLEGVLN